MRIVLVATPWYEVPPLRYGGIEQVVALLADGLVARGHDVTLVTAGAQATRCQHVVTTYEAPQGERIGMALPEVVHAARTAAGLAALNVDLVHDHSTAGPLLAPGRKWPTVVTTHNDVTGEHGDVLRALRDHVTTVAISRQQRRLAPDLPWAGVVYNGVDLDDWSFAAGKDDFVLFLGRASQGKAPHVAIDAARAAGRRIVVAAKCVEASERAYFAEQIAPRLGPGVEWLGEVDRATKRELLSRACALVFPIAWDEPFGLVMVEAMASGTPVVAMRRGSVDEVVVDGHTGWVCDSFLQLVEHLRDPSTVDPSACREHVRNRFSAEAMVSGYEAVYARVLDRARWHRSRNLPGQGRAHGASLTG